MPLIPLHNRNRELIAEVLVDEDDFADLQQFKWCMTDGYASTTFINKSGERIVTRMHRYILKVVSPDWVVDHKNGNRLDNRKENLRKATPTENSRNRKKRVGTASRFFGVTKSKRKWRALYAHRNLGNFDTEEAAAIAYNDAIDEADDQFSPKNNVDLSFRAPRSIPFKTLDLPQGITLNRKNQKYEARLTIGTKRVQKRGFSSISDAQAALKELQLQKERYIEMQKLQPKLLSQQIARDEDGVAIITCKGKNYKFDVKVDDEDYLKFSNYACNQNQYGYPNVNIGGKVQGLHRAIMDAKPGTIVDHKNHNVKDARKANLRFVTRSENAYNRSLKRGKKFHNVFLHKRGDYEVFVAKDRCCHYGGSFHLEEDAARAADTLALKLYGSFANLNFPVQQSSA